MTIDAERIFGSMSEAEKRRVRVKARTSFINPDNMTVGEFVYFAIKHGIIDNCRERDGENSNPTGGHDDSGHDDSGHDDSGHDDGHDDSGDGDSGDGDSGDGDSGDGDGDGDSGDGDGVPPATDPITQLIDDRCQLHISAHEKRIKHGDRATTTTTTTIRVIIPERNDVVIKHAHKLLPDALKIASDTQRNLYMYGPSGSGKTTLAQQIAKSLGLNFDMIGQVLEPYSLFGYKNAAGEYEETGFYRAFTQGGVFLFDELDRYAPGAFVALNAALAQRKASFPGIGTISAHDNFVAIGAGNTLCRGGDRVYTSAQAQDAAAIQRFILMRIDYDEALERELALAQNEDAGTWVDDVQRWRKRVEYAQLPYLVTPRASIEGAKLLKDGFARKDVEQMTVFAGVPESDAAQIRARY